MGLMGGNSVFEHREAYFPGTFTLFEWWQRMIMHGDTLEVHSMAAMVLAVHCICVLMLKSSLKIYYRRLLVLSRDVLVEEV